MFPSRRLARTLLILFPALLAFAPAALADGCNHSASAPIALVRGGPEHRLLLFWAGEDCNAAVTGRAVLNADGNAVYLFIADANRARIKEPGIPPHAPDFVPPLAELLEAEVSTMATTGSIGAYPETDGDIHPVADPVTWARARAADVPMMCHSTGLSVEACLWLDPATGQMEMLFERGS